MGGGGGVRVHGCTNRGGVGGGGNSEWRRVFKFVITVYLLLASVLHC